MDRMPGLFNDSRVITATYATRSLPLIKDGRGGGEREDERKEGEEIQFFFILPCVVKMPRRSAREPASRDFIRAEPCNCKGNHRFHPAAIMIMVMMQIIKSIC